MAEKKKRSYYRAYLNDYKANPAGGYVYTGRSYVLDGDAVDRRRYRIAVILMTVLAAVFTAAPECLPPTDMSRSWTTILPWAMSVIAVFLIAWASVRLAYRFDDLKEYVYTRTAVRLPFYAAAGAVTAAITLIAQVIYIIVNGAGDPPWPTVIRPVCAALDAVTCFVFFRSARRARFSVK